MISPLLISSYALRTSQDGSPPKKATAEPAADVSKTAEEPAVEEKKVEEPVVEEKKDAEPVVKEIESAAEAAAAGAEAPAVAQQ